MLRTLTVQWLHDSSTLSAKGESRVGVKDWVLLVPCLRIKSKKNYLSKLFIYNQDKN